VSLAVQPGDRIGLVGPNGAGKTTLLRIAAGLEPCDAGRVSLPRDVRVALLRQEIDPQRARSVREEAASALAELESLEAELRALEAQMVRDGGEVPAALAERYDRCRAAFELGGGFERGARVERVLEGLGFDAEARERPLSSFSGGWLMRVELAKLLLAAPDVLLLDEPTNHLDLPSIEWFEEVLAGYRGAVVAVSHDRSFLRRHARRVAELEAGHFALCEGGYDAWLAQKAERREQLLARQRHDERERAETQRFIERFRSKASKAKQVQSRIRALERRERVEAPQPHSRAMRLRIPPALRAGEEVLRLEGIHKRYGERAVYAGVDLALRRGDRVALAGPNGAGKSTLLRIAAGALSFDAGRRVLGHNVEVAFFAQHQLEVLDERRSVLDELASGARSDDVPRLRGHLGAFLFSGDDVEKRVAVLSGGEKARLALAKLLLRPANFLVLDEPTNHLDVASCEVLEQALRGFEGTLLFISHDRAFINALATRVVEVRAGALREFSGDYDAYLARRAGEAAPPDLPVAAAPAAGPEAKRERIAARERERASARQLERARRQLAAVEEEILEREEGLEELARELAEPEVYRDADEVRRVGAERGELRAAIEALYRDWERLAGEIEAAGAGDPPSD
jgi:ATP-binding cassette subfamily F protein 3